MNEELYQGLIALNGAITTNHKQECQFFSKWGNMKSSVPKGFESDDNLMQVMDLLKDVQTSLISFSALNKKILEVADMIITANGQKEEP